MPTVRSTTVTAMTQISASQPGFIWRDQSKLTISTQLAPFPVGYLLSKLSAPLF